MTKVRQAAACIVSCVVLMAWQERGSAQENNASITKGVFEFQKRLKDDGVIGVISQIGECWKQAGENLSQDTVAFCFTIDYSANDFSEFVSKKEGSIQPEFLGIERVLSRANVALKRMKVEQSERGKLISGWIKLSRMVLLAKNHPNVVTTQAEDQLTFGKAKQAVSTKIGNPSAAKFENLEKHSVVNFKGVLTTVVCGTVDFKTRSGSSAGPRRFVYFLDDQSAYLDAGKVTSPDLGRAIIKNFCS
jgi:hypothetical protein